LALYHFNETGGTSVNDASPNNNDGTTLNSPTFAPNEEFSVKANFSGLSEEILASETKNYILVYDFNGNASDGDTYKTKINANADITATGETSGEPISVLGAPVTGHTKTIATTGSFTVETGPNNPGPKTITADASKVPMLQAKITTSSAEAIDFSSLSINTIGTGHDVNHLDTVAGVELYLDANANGLYENGIDQYLGQGVYDANDGVATLSTSNRRIPAATTEYWLVIQNFNNQADSGATFTARINSPSNFVATGANTGNNISPSGSAIIGGTQTISTLGSITLSLGNNSPDDEYITNDAANVEMMQLQIQTSAAEAVKITNLKFKASGTGHDTTDIVRDSVKLVHDLNNDGLYDAGIDTLLDFGSFSADNGLVQFNFGGDSVELDANYSYNWLLVSDFDTSASDNETFKTSVELNSYLEAVGVSTGQSITVTGAPFTGAIKTISSIGTLTLTAAPTNPSSSNETNDAQGVVMLALRMSTSDAEDIRVDSLTINSAGTLLENVRISSVQLFQDLNNNGILDLTIDPQIDSTRAFTADNGTILFDTIADTITAGSYRDYLIVYNLDGTSGPDSTFRTILSNNSRVKAKGLSGTEHDVTITGAPIYGNYKTITNSGSLTLSEGDYNIQPSNITVDATEVPMVQVKLTASSAEDIEVNNITLRAGGTFAPEDDISSYGIELYEDVNNNGTIDNGVDEFIGSAEKFGSGAISFNGTTGFIEAPHSESLSLEGSAMTIEGWFKTSTTSGNQIIVNKENSYEVGINGGDLEVAIQTDAPGGWFWSTGPSVSTDTWYHFAVTYDGDKTRIYLDGSRELELDDARNKGDITPSNNPLRIGNRISGGGSYFQGQMDDIRISNSARYTGATHTVPTSAYNTDANTVALYAFDESSGSVILDASENQNNGELYSGATRVESGAGFSSSTVSIATTGQEIQKGNSENWIARLSFNGNATVGQTANLTISSNEISATGKTTESNIEADGTSVSGGTQTFSNTGSLTLSGNGPDEGNISKNAQSQPMLILILSAGTAEDINISKIECKASGSGDDIADVDSVDIWEDLNNNNAVDPGIDRLIVSGLTYSTDNGKISHSLSSVEVIDSATSEQWIIAYNFNGNPANNDQFTTSIELASYVTAEGASTGSPITPSLPGGNAVTGGTQTIKTIGQLSVQLGDNNPSITTVENAAEYHVFMQANFAANPADTLDIDTLSISENGTIDETTAFTDVRLFLDGDDNGLLDFVNDIDLGTGTRYGNYFRFTSLDQFIPPGESKNYLIVATLNGTAAENKTILFKLPSNDSITAYGRTSGIQANVIGAPVTGNTVTVKNVGTLTVGVPCHRCPDDVGLDS
jgi:hypothetical protein